MGSWHTTDMITHAPIRWNDPIRVVVLKQSTYAIGCGGITYPTGMWEPVGPAIKGKYNDYGSIESVEDSIGTGWLNHLIKLDENVMEELRSHCIEDKTPIEIVCLAVERGLIYFKERDYFFKNDDEDGEIPFEDEESTPPKVPPVMRKYLCLWMVHESTWQKMQTLEFERLRNTPIDEAIKDLKETYKKRSEVEKEKLALWHWRLGDKVRELTRNNLHVTTVFDWGVNQELFDETVDALAELSRVSDGMDATRHYFCPIAGAGSQSTNYEAYKALAELALEQAEDGLKWEWGDYDDE